MPCPHFSISIVKGSKGKSVVAAAAYDSGQKLYSERDMKYKDYSRRKDVIYEEVMLPAHAPPEYRNREALWNSVEGNEKRFDAQYARRIIAALPRELSWKENIDLVRAFCQENFVFKGMCCDLAIHDDGKGNPHAHILLTLRGINENGKWMPKSRMVYELDENGNKKKASEREL